jgi:hypothetical protein
MSIDQQLRDLAARWADVPAGERANAQLYLSELAQALEVEPPQPRGSGYEFELPVKVVSRDGKESVNFIDLFKRGCFVLEAKDADSAGSDDARLRRAFGQALSYAHALPGGPPPYLLVLDVGSTLLLWDRWAGSFGGFNLGQRIHLPTLADHPEQIALLRDVWTQPQVRDPRARAAAVTREVAARLAELSASLEKRGFPPELVARFLMRCVFTMFAEDVGLLPGHPFQEALQTFLTDPEEFASATSELWSAMDQGRRFGLRKLLRFNGHFFADPETLPLTRADMLVLLQASRADWAHVEPTIFGTLFTRALDPEERHRLGAEFTPREYVERLVRQTVDVPLRARWAPVQAEVLRLRESGRKKDAEAALAHLREFHEELRSLRFLDPACGSGNFLYVTLHTVKRLELEVLREIERITHQPELAVQEVGPPQFHGIEVKPWAREIAELTLWIGHHQFWAEHHGGVQPPEPVLRDTGTLELRDAVLAWDEIIHRPERDRPDPTPRIPHPVTGKLVPDPEAKLPYLEYIGARAAEWPQADFIVGNPPYMGTKRMRDAFGDGYVEALRRAYPQVPLSADFVMYWWQRAAAEVADGRALRAGLITTNTIVQKQNRLIIDAAAKDGAGVSWAIADHPWVDESGSAAVRVAMTVVSRKPLSVTLVQVDEAAQVIREIVAERLNADLSTDADVASAAAKSLRANQGLAAFGFALYGAGFILDAAEAHSLLSLDFRHGTVIKPYRNGRDIAARPRGVYVMDFAYMEEDEARSYPVLFDLVRNRVKPGRDANAREVIRRFWWRFGWPRRELREALCSLQRYIVTPETAKHRFFTFLDAEVAPDHMLVCVASDESFHLGVLSSAIHLTWALASGGTLEDRPRYNKTVCFDAFPFPDPTPVQRGAIADIAEELDRHRKEALARDERVTMTGMYNVLEKLRSGAALAAKEREIHELAACGVLAEYHDALDKLVAGAYGWPWPLSREVILERLVALHDARVAEERAGVVRWLRPEYQMPRFGSGAEVEVAPAATPTTPSPAAAPRPWPASVIAQLTAVQSLLDVASLTAEEAAERFVDAPLETVRAQLELLSGAGEAWRDADDRYHRAEQPV